MISMNKLVVNIKRTLQQLEGEVRLHVPEVELPDTVEEVLRNRELKRLVLSTCSEWSLQIRVSRLSLESVVSRHERHEWRVSLTFESQR